MKKLLPSAVLAVVVSGVLAAQSFAGCCFGLFYRHCGCCSCGATFCVRQYNAFSPVCSGTVFCDGCCPFGACGAGGCGAGGCGVMPYSGVLPGACADGAGFGSLPAADPVAGAPAPAAPLPNGSTSQLVNDRPIQSAAYRPASFILPSTLPAIAPKQLQPQMMNAPSYWGN